MSEGPNATFYCFRESGKWYVTGRGVLPPETFQPYFRATPPLPTVLAVNGGRWPGLSSGAGTGMRRIAVPDDSVDYGYPIMIGPEE